MSNLALLLLCAILGYALSRARKIPENTPTALSGFIIWVSLPALSLSVLPSMRFERELLFPMVMPWLVFAGALAVFSLLGRVWGWSRATVGALVLTAGLGNTSFIGFPVIEALHGRDGLAIAVLADQPGSFLILSTAGIAIAQFFAGSRVAPRALLTRIIAFPPFIAMLVSLTILRGVVLPASLQSALERLASTLVPLALFSVGARLRFGGKQIGARLRPLAAGVIYKLILAPAAILGLYWALGARGLVLRVSVLEAAMAPMITAAVIAAEKGLDPELSDLMLVVGIPFSALTLLAWIQI